MNTQALKPYSPKDYIWIDVWGKYMGSMHYYIEQQQSRASRDLAPLTAIHSSTERDDDGTDKEIWHTLEDIESETTRHRIKQLASHLGHEIPKEVLEKWES